MSGLPSTRTKGRIVPVSLAEGWSEGSRGQNPVTCPSVNSPAVTLVRQMARAARPSNAPQERGRGAHTRKETT